MAFLCPVRVRKARRKRSRSSSDLITPGRITGSASIDTLVRVGLEKEHGLKSDAKMTVLHDFVPCVDDELEVRRGDHVTVLYRENDWLYVIAADNREGFIPHTYVVPIGNSVDDMALNAARRTSVSGQLLTRKTSLQNLTSNLRITKSPSVSSLPVHLQSTPKTELSKQLQSGIYMSDTNIYDAQVFAKRSYGKYIVLFDFNARQENDISVDRGEFVTVLNKDDPDWAWVMKMQGAEGFVPGSFICPAEGQHVTDTPFKITSSNGITNHKSADGDVQKLCAHGTKLVTLYDYAAQAHDDLSVKRGEYLYADLGRQDQSGWVWAYSPSAQRAGYIPRAYAKPPNITNL